MQKRGQAAMEFLMTYGWAILAAIIAIAVLAYFGVFSPGKYMSNICTIAAPGSCDEYSITTSGITLVIRNGLGDIMAVSSVNVTGCGSTASVTPTTSIPDGGIGTATVPCAPVLTAGNKFKGDITITYKKGTSGTIDQKVTGSISGRVS